MRSDLTRPVPWQVTPAVRLVRGGALVGLRLATCLAFMLPTAVQAQVTHGPPRIRNVYIPTSELQLLFASPSKGVLMPRDKVLALWEEARRRSAIPTSSASLPVDAVLSQAAYDAQLGDHELRLRGRIQVSVLREGRQVIALPFGGLAIESAQLGGQPAGFGRNDDGTLFLMLEKQGRFELDLEMSAPLASKGGDLAVTLRLPPVPASEIAIRLDKGKQLLLGEMLLQSEGEENGRQLFRIAVGSEGLVPRQALMPGVGATGSASAGSSVSHLANTGEASDIPNTGGASGTPNTGGASGTPSTGLEGALVPLVIAERSAGGNRAPLVLVHSHSTGWIEPAGLRWEAVLDLDVCARATDTFRLQLPGSIDLAEVAAPDLGPWTTQQQADGSSIVSLTFRKPVLGQRAVRLVGFAPVPTAASWDFPTVKLLESASHAGRISLNCSPSLRVEVGELVGVRPERLMSDSAEASPATAGTPLPFAFWDENFKLPLRVTERRRTVRASVATLVEVDRSGAVLRGSLSLEPRYSSVFDVQVQLPRDWEVTSVLSADKPVEWEPVPRAEAKAEAKAAEEASWQTVRFNLAEPLAPGRSLQIAVNARRHPDHWLEQDEGFQELALPDLRLVGADEVEGTVLIQAPPDIELLASDLSDELQPVAAEGPRSGPAEAAGTALQYRYRDGSPKKGRLRVRMKPARISAETLAFVRLDRGKLDVHYQADLHIRQGTARQIRFTLPAAAGEKIQIVPVDSPVRIIEQRHSPLSGKGEDKADAYLWQLVLDQPVTGNLTLALDFSRTCSTPSVDGRIAESAGGDAASAEDGNHMAVPVLAFEDVSRQDGIVAVEAADDQQIGCEPENLRDLDPADVRKPRAYAPSHRIVAAYQYQRLPYRLAISATRHASGSVLTGICESAEIISVPEHDGRMRHQARFRLRSLNLPHVPVVLPKDADLWSATLDGAPVEVRRKQGAYIVPLPAGQAGAADTDRELALLYETRGPRWDASGLVGRLWPQTVRQAAPEIAVTTLGTTWHVHAPDGTDLVSSSGDFEPESPLTRPTLSAWLAETIARESTSGLLWKFAGLVAAVVLAGSFALVRTAKGCTTNAVEILVVISIIGVLIALLLPATQSAREAARRSQCSNNLKQIALALHNYHEVYKQFPPAAIGPSNVPRDRQFSWLVAILPFMEQTALYTNLRLDLPCDHPHNAGLLQVPLTTLLCPSDPSRTTQDGSCKTSYVAITGADSTRGAGSTRGVIGFDRGLRFDEIVDGTSNTILVGEVTDGGPWFAGGRGTARRIDDWIEKKVWSQHPDGGTFALADGSVRFFTSSIEPQTLRDFATAQGLETIVLEGIGGATAPVAVETTKTTTTENDPGPMYRKTEKAKPGEPPASALKGKGLLIPPARTGTELPKMDSSPGQEPPVQTEAAPQEKPSPQAAREPIAAGRERARLSIGVALETQGGQAIRFRREGGPGELVFGIQDRGFARAAQWFLVAAALLAAWVWRQRPGPQRAIAMVLGLTLPIGLSGLVPLALTPLLDGVLLGALAAGLLWMLPRFFQAVKASMSGSAAGALAVGVGLLLAVGSSAAEEPQGKQDDSAATNRTHARDLTLFIPYEPGKGSPLASSQVYLPHDEFLRLWKLAHPEKPDPVSPTVRAIVSHAEFSGRLQNDVARFDGRLVVHHLADEWTRVALPLGKVAFEKIEMDGRPAFLAGADGDLPAIYVEKPGLHVVDIRFGVSVSRLGATGQLSIPVRPVPSGRLLFELPQAPLEVQVSGGPGGWRRQLPAGEGKDAEQRGDPRALKTPPGGAGKDRGGQCVCVPLGGNDVSIRWQPPRAEIREAQLMSAEQALLIEVLDSGVHLYSKFRYRVQQGAVRELRLRIPTGVAVRQVRGAEVADWSIEAVAPGLQPAGQQLVVSLKTARTAGTEVEIDAFRVDRQGTGNLDVQSLEPLGVARETGHIAIGCASHFRVRIGEMAGLDQIDRGGLDLPRVPSDGSAVMSAYRYTSRPWRLRLEVERDRMRVEVSDRTAIAVTARQTVLRSLLTVNVVGAPVRSLGLRLPDSIRVSQVQTPPAADWFIESDDKGRRLRVEFSKPAVGKLELAVSGSIARDSQQPDLVLPGVTIEEASTHRGQLVIYLDDDLQAVLTDGGGARSVDPAAVDSALRSAGNRQADYAFQYDSPPKGLRVRLTPAPSRLNANVTTVVSVREGAVAYVSRVDFEVRQARRSRFRVMAPQWMGDDVEVRGEQIRQIRTEAAGANRTWDVELQQPVRGVYRLHLVQTVPLPNDGTVRAAVIRPLDVERSRSHIVLENTTADEIAATTVAGATPVPIAEVPEGLADTVRRQAVAAYRVGENTEMAWQRRTREQETALTACINMADLTTVIHADGSYRARVIYNIRNFTMQFLELELPSGSRIWSVHVSGQPVRPATVERQGRTITLLPLQKISAGDFSSKVVMIYSGDLGHPLGRWTRVGPQAPQILSEIPVSRTLWTVLLPREYQVSRIKGESNLDEVEAAYQQEERKLSFLNELRQIVQVAGSKSDSAAKYKAQSNLKQVGVALDDYAGQNALAGAKNAADVQTQAQQIAAEVKRLEELKTDGKRADDESFYFTQPKREPQGAEPAMDLDRLFEKLPAMETTDGEKAGPKEPEPKSQDQAREPAPEGRGDLRKQSGEQLTKLQTTRQGETADGQRPGKPLPGDEQDTPVAPPAIAAATNQLPLDLELALVGTPHHFCKLHGEPRLVLRVRHENLGRGLSAAVWASLCLVVAGVFIRSLRRPDAMARARHGWPWLAAVAGAAWLFLLPAGGFGLAVVVIALFALASRRQKLSGPNAKPSNESRAVVG